MGCQRCLNTSREESKKKKDSMKVEEGGVHHKIYERCCMKS
jgi:hypothetical protein